MDDMSFGNLELMSQIRRFPEKDPLANRTIWKNVKKYEKEGTSLKINNGRSGWRRTDRTEETIEVI